MIKKLISTAIVSSVVGSASANPELGYMMLNKDKHQFFNATIAIDALPAELADKKLKVKLGSVTDFYRHNIEYNKQVSSLRFKVTRDGNGKALIRVRSVREITAEQLKAVVKLTVGKQKIYGVYDFRLTPNQGRQVTLNLLNADHKPTDPPRITKKVQSLQKKPLPSISAATGYQDVNKGGNTSFHDQYQVKSGQSISRIAMELHPRYPEMPSWRSVMNRLTALNPAAFINGDINKLRADARLKLPESSQLRTPVMADTPTADTLTEAETSNLVSSDKIAKKDEPVMAQNQGSKESPNTTRSNALNSTIIINDLPAELAGNDNLKVRLGSITDFYRQGIDYNHQVASLRFETVTNSNKETVIRAHGIRDISEQQLTAVVKLSVGRKKVYGLYELRSDKAGQHLTFNLLGRSNQKKAQVVKPVQIATQAPADKGKAASLVVDDRTKKKALELLRNKLLGYEQARSPATERKTVAIGHHEKEPERHGSSSNNHYRVAKGDTISTIAMNLVRAYPQAPSWRAVMKLLVIQNPDAFIDGDINKIRIGTVLTLPEKRHFDQLYDIAPGESISVIAWQLQQKYPQPGGWKGMMEQLIRMNPEAFIDGNPHKLREGEFLIIPGAGLSGIEAERQTLPQRPQWNAHNQLESQMPDPGLQDLPRKQLEELSVQETAESVYRITESESLAAIAHQLMPDYPQFDSWYGLMQELVKLNPDLFAENDIGAIKAGTVLQLPEKKSRVHQADPMPEPSLPEKRNSAEGNSEGLSDNMAVPAYDKISKSLLSGIRKESSYAVPQGYSISMVAIKLFPKFPEYESWPELMDALYQLNSDAFVDNDINQLSSGAQLKLPGITKTG